MNAIIVNFMFCESCQNVDYKMKKNWAYVSLQAHCMSVVVHFGVCLITQDVFRVTGRLFVPRAVCATVSHAPSRQGALGEHHEKQNRAAPYERSHILQTNIEGIIVYVTVSWLVFSWQTAL